MENHVLFLKYSFFYVLNDPFNFESYESLWLLTENVEWSFEYIFRGVARTAANI